MQELLQEGGSLHVGLGLEMLATSSFEYDAQTLPKSLEPRVNRNLFTSFDIGRMCLVKRKGLGGWTRCFFEAVTEGCH